MLYKIAPQISKMALRPKKTTYIKNHPFKGVYDRNHGNLFLIGGGASTLGAGASRLGIGAPTALGAPTLGLGAPRAKKSP